MRISLFRQVVKENKLSAKFAPIFTVSPDLDDVCTRVVDYIGVNFRVRDEPLVKEMLLDAITAWRAARKHGDPNVAFMKGLVDLHRILTHDLHRKLTHPKSC